MAMTNREQRVIRAFFSCINSGAFTPEYVVELCEDASKYGWMSAEAKKQFYAELKQMYHIDTPEIIIIEMPEIPAEENAEPEVMEEETPTVEAEEQTEETQPEIGSEEG